LAPTQQQYLQSELSNSTIDIIERKAVVEHQYKITLELRYGTVPKQSFFFNSSKVHRILNDSQVAISDIRVCFHDRCVKGIVLIDIALSSRKRHALEKRKVED